MVLFIFFCKKRNPEAEVISSWAVTNIFTKLSGSQGNTIRKSVTGKFRKKCKIICAHLNIYQRLTSVEESINDHINTMPKLWMEIRQLCSYPINKVAIAAGIELNVGLATWIL